MLCRSVLRCDSPTQHIEILYSESVPEMASVDLSKCIAVYEDGCYEIDVEISALDLKRITRIDVYLNGSSKGIVSFSYSDESMIRGQVIFSDNDPDKKANSRPHQLFLLQYDLAVLSFAITLEDGTTEEVFSPYFLCMSKHQEDVTNIQTMIEELSGFDIQEMGELLFSNKGATKATGLHKGDWQRKAFRSLNSYIQLVEGIVVCYKNNFSYFKTKGHHTIGKKSVFEAFDDIKTLNVDSISWLMQNLDQLNEIPDNQGIEFQGKWYLPARVKNENKCRSWDVYENRVVVGFIQTVYRNAKSVFDDLSADVMKEEVIVEKINRTTPKEYRAPIITVRTLQISYCRIMLQKLSQLIDVLRVLCNEYSTLFPVCSNIIATLPRKTKTFQEVSPYVQVFNNIVLWFQYGEYSLLKDRLILQVKTLDKLFEYYCLYQLLNLFSYAGFVPINDCPPAVSIHYPVNDGKYQNETDVANLYRLEKNGVKISLYYQPVIYSDRFEANTGLTMYRTTRTQRSWYYSPDFVVKFEGEGRDEEYVIFDAKFATRDNIKEHYLDKVINKYANQCAIANKNAAPRMVWILQGRMRASDMQPIWRYHNSSFAYRFKPTTSYGIVAINTKTDIKQRFWDEIKSCVECIV